MQAHSYTVLHASQGLQHAPPVPREVQTVVPQHMLAGRQGGGRGFLLGQTSVCLHHRVCTVAGVRISKIIS